MANRQTAGFGLVPVGTVGSTPSTQGQGKYFIDAAYDKNLYQNSAVQSKVGYIKTCLLYTSPSPRDAHESRMPSSA